MGILLAPLFSFLIASRSNAYTTYAMNAKGTTTHFSDETGSKTATRGEYSHLKNQLLSDVDELLLNMKCYMEDTHTECTFTGVKFLSDCSSTGYQPQSNKRFYFKDDIKRH